MRHHGSRRRAKHPAPHMWPSSLIGCMRRAATMERQEESEMRLKLLSPGEMSEDQKQTYDESIAGKRGAPPPPMMAWLNSPEMARHATTLGGLPPCLLLFLFLNIETSGTA